MYKISSAAKNTELLILLNVPSDFYQTEKKTLLQYTRLSLEG